MRMLDALESLKYFFARRYHDQGYWFDVSPGLRYINVAAFNGKHCVDVRISDERLRVTDDVASLLRDVCDELDRKIAVFAYAPEPPEKFGPYHLRYRPARNRVRLHRRAA